MINNVSYSTTKSNLEEFEEDPRSTKLSPSKQVKWQGWLKETESGLVRDIEIKHMLVKKSKEISGFCSIKDISMRIKGVVTEQELLEFELLDKQGTRIFIFRAEMMGNVLFGKYRECRYHEKGIFELKMESEAWIGYLEVNDNKDKMEIPLNVNYQGVYSIGKDENGLYLVDGEFDSVEKKCNFEIFYFGISTSSHFNGKWSVINDQFVKISGNWSLPQSAFGKFTLTGKLSSLYHDVMNLDDGIFPKQTDRRAESSSELLLNHLNGKIKSEDQTIFMSVQQSSRSRNPSSMPITHSKIPKALVTLKDQRKAIWTFHPKAS